MIIVLSPSKTLDFLTPRTVAQHTEPEMLAQSHELIMELRRYAPRDIARLMHVSAKIAQLNHERYQRFQTPFTLENARQALLAFKGDVYEPINAAHYSLEDLAFAQAHLRILSGLYGVLRPLDLIQPYRLEMGAALKTPRGSDLYAFWGDCITEALNRALAQEGGALLVNLASAEYFKAVRPARLNAEVITPVFKENRGGRLRVIGLLAKKARGAMTAFVIRNRLRKANDLKQFNGMGYAYVKELSTAATFVFVR